VLEIPDSTQRGEYLSLLEVSDIWGIGPRRAKRLKASGVLTALDFTRLPRDYVKKKFTIAGLHTWLELQGVPCIPLGAAPRSKKAIVTSRSFGHPVTRLDDLREALSHYASRAAEKLRAQKGQAATILVWVQIYTGDAQQPLKGVLQSQAMNPATSRTTEIVRAGMKALESIFIPDRRYKKLGVMLTGIENEGGVQLSLLREPDRREDRLMAVLDQVNAKWGRETLFAASSGIKRPWQMRQEMRSPRYTTVWAELPVALA
jgi:DNA polymerase V